MRPPAACRSCSRMVEHAACTGVDGNDMAFTAGRRSATPTTSNAMSSAANTWLPEAEKRERKSGEAWRTTTSPAWRSTVLEEETLEATPSITTYVGLRPCDAKRSAPSAPRFSTACLLLILTLVARIPRSMSRLLRPTTLSPTGISTGMLGVGPATRRSPAITRGFLAAGAATRSARRFCIRYVAFVASGTQA